MKPYPKTLVDKVWFTYSTLESDIAQIELHQFSNASLKDNAAAIYIIIIIPLWIMMRLVASKSKLVQIEFQTVYIGQFN